jgi:replication factor C small subunit
MKSGEFLWEQAYRPDTIDRVGLPIKLKNQFKEFIKEDEIGNMIFFGTPGTGKTTTAIALCKDIGADYKVIKASDDNGIDFFRRDVKNFASSSSLRGGIKVVILDEGDYLTAGAQALIRGMTEDVSQHCRFIITCNYPNKLISAIQDRMQMVSFNSYDGDKDKAQAMMVVYHNLSNMLKSEEVKFDTKVLKTFLAKNFPANRHIVKELQLYCQYTKVLDVGILAVKDKDIDSIFLLLKKKNYKNMRQWAAENSLDISQIINLMFNSLDKYVAEDSIISFISILEDYQRNLHVPSLEIHLTMMALEMMGCDYK